MESSKNIIWKIECLIFFSFCVSIFSSLIDKHISKKEIMLTVKGLNLADPFYWIYAFRVATNNLFNTDFVFFYWILAIAYLIQLFKQFSL